MVIIDIFYAVIGLENNYKIMPQQHVAQIVEELMETLFLISIHIHKIKK